MTASLETHRLSQSDTALLQSLVDGSGVFEVSEAFFDLSLKEACGASVWVVSRNSGAVRLSTEWFISSVGNRYATLIVDDTPAGSASQARVKACGAWLRDVNILSVEFEGDEVEIDAGLEFFSHTNEPAYIVIADPRNHSEKCLLVSGSEPYWLLSGLPIRRRPLTTTSTSNH
jgi:hypothetical protein